MSTLKILLNLEPAKDRRVIDPEVRAVFTDAKRGPLPGTGGRPPKHKPGPAKGTFTAMQARALDKGRAVIEAKRRARFSRVLELVNAGYCGRNLLYSILLEEDKELTARTIRRDFLDLEAMGLIHFWKRTFIIPAFYIGSSMEIYKIVEKSRNA